MRDAVDVLDDDRVLDELGGAVDLGRELAPDRDLFLEVVKLIWC